MDAFIGGFATDPTRILRFGIPPCSVVEAIQGGIVAVGRVSPVERAGSGGWLGFFR